MAKKWVKDRTEMENFIQQCDVCCIANVSPDGSPYIFTVNHVFYNGKIYFHGALKGKKMDNIAHNPRVCLEVYRIDRIIQGAKARDVGTRYYSVVVHGRARQITDFETKRDVLIALTDKYARESYSHRQRMMSTAQP